MTYEQVLCPNDTLLLNNSYLLQQFSLHTHEITPFANKKNSMKTMLDASGDLALWYTGEEIIVFDFGSNTEAVSYTHLDVYKRQGLLHVRGPYQRRRSRRIPGGEGHILPFQGGDEIGRAHV